jgi:sulfonate transport system permease protein
VKALRSRIRPVLVGLWLPCVVFAAWWAASADSQSTFFPPLSKIMAALQHVWLFAEFGADVLPSLRNLFVGFLLALIGGLVIGVILGLLPTLELIADPLLQFLRAVPSIALYPLFIVIIGIGDLSKIVLIAVSAAWPILLNTVDGIKGIDPECRRITRVYRVTRRETLFRVILPGAFPQIAAGITVGLSISIVLMVASELYASTQGIGYYLVLAQQSFAMSDVWATTILLGILGYLISLGWRAIESWLLRWRPSA